METRKCALTDDSNRPASLGAREAIFIGPFDREIRVSADRKTITHCAMDWSGTYTPAQLLTWVPFYERLATDAAMPRAKADLRSSTPLGICWRVGDNG